MKCAIRRSFLLLELMIAFAMVAFTLLPLISPHFYIYQQQRRFVDKIDLDVAISNFYALILEQLEKNEIPWNQLEQKHHFPIDDQLWRKLGYDKPLPFLGQYWFNIVIGKKNERYGLYRVELNIALVPKMHFKNDNEKEKKSLSYKYEIFLSRIFQTVQNPTSNKEKEEPS